MEVYKYIGSYSVLKQSLENKKILVSDFRACNDLYEFNPFIDSESLTRFLDNYSHIKEYGISDLALFCAYFLSLYNHETKAYLDILIRREHRSSPLISMMYDESIKHVINASELFMEQVVFSGNVRCPQTIAKFLRNLYSYHFKFSSFSRSYNNIIDVGSLFIQSHRILLSF